MSREVSVCEHRESADRDSTHSVPRPQVESDHIALNLPSNLPLNVQVSQLQWQNRHLVILLNSQRAAIDGITAATRAMVRDWFSWQSELTGVFLAGRTLVEAGKELSHFTLSLARKCASLTALNAALRTTAGDLHSQVSSQSMELATVRCALNIAQGQTASENIAEQSRHRLHNALASVEQKASSLESVAMQSMETIDSLCSANLELRGALQRARSSLDGMSSEVHSLRAAVAGHASEQCRAVEAARAQASATIAELASAVTDLRREQLVSQRASWLLDGAAAAASNRVRDLSARLARVELQCEIAEAERASWACRYAAVAELAECSASEYHSAATTASLNAALVAERAEVDELAGRVAMLEAQLVDKCSELGSVKSDLAAARAANVRVVVQSERRAPPTAPSPPIPSSSCSVAVRQPPAASRPPVQCTAASASSLHLSAPLSFSRPLPSRGDAPFGAPSQPRSTASVSSLSADELASLEFHLPPKKRATTRNAPAPRRPPSRDCDSLSSLEGGHPVSPPASSKKQRKRKKRALLR